MTFIAARLSPDAAVWRELVWIVTILYFLRYCCFRVAGHSTILSCWAGEDDIYAGCYFSFFFAMLYYYYFAEMIDYDTLSKQRVRSKQELQDAGHWWVTVYFQTALAGPGMSNVCVSFLHASSCLLKLCDWRARKEFIERLNKRRGCTLKPGCSHQATSRSSFKAWQGVVRSTEKRRGSRAGAVCDRKMCVRACAWIHLPFNGVHTRVQSVHLPGPYIVYYCPLPPPNKKRLIFITHCGGFLL